MKRYYIYYNQLYLVRSRSDQELTMSDTTEQQNEILQELELILATTKQINNNLVKSIELLGLDVEIKESVMLSDSEQKRSENSIADTGTKQKSPMTYSYKEMVDKNVQVLTSILQVLNAI